MTVRLRRRGLARQACAFGMVVGVCALGCIKPIDVLRSSPRADGGDVAATDAAIDRLDATPVDGPDRGDSDPPQDVVDPPDEAGSDGSTDGSRPDAPGAVCGFETCSDGQECCTLTGFCHPAGCVDCCPAPSDGGFHCITAGCPTGLDCCFFSGLCYDPRCVTCCL